MGVSFPPELRAICHRLVYSIVEARTRRRAEVRCLRKA